MSSRLDLGPADLDRLEDALEDLELGLDTDADVDVDDPVAQRLVEYRALLQLSREALPLEDVPAGLLDGVLAEARQAAASGVAAAAAAPAPSFWARWRLGVWVPTLAFAGSAAALLLVLVPKQGQEPAAVAQHEGGYASADARREAPSAAAPAEQAEDLRLAFGEAESKSELDAYADDPQRGEGLAIGERAPDPEPAAAPVEEEAGADQAPGKSAARRKATSGSSSTATGSIGGSGSGAGGAPSKVPSAPTTNKGKPAPEPEPELKDDKKKQANEDVVDLWPEIARADSDRRGGGCGLAKMRYDKLRKTDDSRVRARALAGLGLCEAAADDMSTAKKLFAQARAADPGVSGFIDTELAILESTRANARDPSPQQAD